MTTPAQDVRKLVDDHGLDTVLEGLQSVCEKRAADSDHGAPDSISARQHKVYIKAAETLAVLAVQVRRVG